MAQRTYKVFADISTTNAILVSTLAILDSSTDNNFIRKDSLPTGYETYLKPGTLPSVCDASGNQLDMYGVVTLQVELVGYCLAVDSIFCNRQTATCILGTH